MKRLSKEAEDKILSALNDVAALINEGDEPNKAIYKVANDEKIPVGHIELMVHAYNTGRTNLQRKIGTTILEKAAEFPIADYSAIKKMFYPEKVASLADEKRASAVSEEYNYAPNWVNSNTSVMTKAANFKLVDTPYAPEQKDQAEQTRRAYNKVAYYKRGLENIRAYKSELFDKCAKAFDDLVFMFKTTPTNFNEVYENSSLTFGKSAEVLLNRILEKAPKLKTAALNSKKWTSIRIDQQPYKEIKEAIDLMALYKQCNDKIASAEKLFLELEGQLPRPFAQAKTTNSVMDSPSSDEKTAGVFDNVKSLFSGGMNMVGGGDVVKEVAQKATGIKPSDSVLRSDLQKLIDPSHENDLREVQVEATLNDLMANDEIISGHHPEEVLRAFNEINQIAPRAANQKMLIRSLLRRKLQYGGDHSDPVDIQQMLQIENELKSRDQPASLELNNLLGLGATR